MNADLSSPPSLDDDKPWQRWVFAAVGLAALAVVVWLIVKAVNSKPSGPRQQMVKIAVLPDTPPPPPPPPPKEKPPEPEKNEPKPQVQEQPKVQQEAKPEPQQLKMDGPAGDGPSAFAAGQVSSEYKGGEIGTGTGGGGNRLQFAFFTSKLQRDIQAYLSRNSASKLGDYKVTIKVWLSPGGELKAELATPTGDEKTDQALRQALAQLPPVNDVPANLPQPVRLRITNRMTG